MSDETREPSARESGARETGDGAAEVAVPGSGTGAPAHETGPRVVPRRLPFALVLAPWLLGYGVAGAAALWRSLAALARGEPSVHLGHDANLDAWLLFACGVWLVLGFAVLLAAIVLLVLGCRDAHLWMPVAVISLVLLGASVAWVVSFQVGPGETALIWASLCWPTAAAPALAAGRLLAKATGRGP